MYGQSSLSTYVGVALAALLVIALFFLASPLIAVAIALVAGAGMLLVMSRMRRRSEQADDQEQPPLTREGKPTGPTGRSSGEPVSGEG